MLRDCAVRAGIFPRAAFASFARRDHAALTSVVCQLRDVIREQLMATQVRTLGWGTWSLIFALVILILSVVYLAY
jgi:hypothetical protein